MNKIVNNLQPLIDKSKLPKEDVYNLPRAKNYACPQCGKDHPDSDQGYKGGGKRYPRYVNERKGWAGDYYHDWEEVHYCRKCKIEYYLTNGAY